MNIGLPLLLLWLVVVILVGNGELGRKHQPEPFQQVCTVIEGQAGLACRQNRRIGP